MQALRSSKLKSHFLARCLLFVVVWSIGTSAIAWGHSAHQAIAIAAEQSLSPIARKNLQRLLSLERGLTLAALSTWADRQRGVGTGKWHYVNFPLDQCQYKVDRDCPGGECVVEALHRQIAMLGSTAASDAQRLEALKYVVHLVADVHQPLHGGFAHDRGGNTYQVQAFGRGVNLHSLWDAVLVDTIEPDEQKLAAKLVATPSSGYRGKTELGSMVTDAAEESCRIVRQPWFYPDHKMTSTYVVQSTAVIMERLKLSSLRLSTVLNLALRRG